MGKIIEYRGRTEAGRMFSGTASIDNMIGMTPFHIADQLRHQMNGKTGKSTAIEMIQVDDVLYIFSDSIQKVELMNKNI